MIRLVLRENGRLGITPQEPIAGWGVKSQVSATVLIALP
jgi:hypothetical protein